MIAGEIMVRETPEVEPSATLAEAAEKMRDKNARSLVVMESGRLLGMITDSDIILAIADGELPTTIRVWEVMSPLPPAATASTDLMEVVGLMKRHCVRWLPVIEEGRLIGTVSAADVAASLKLTQ